MNYNIRKYIFSPIILLLAYDTAFAAPFFFYQIQNESSEVNEVDVADMCFKEIDNDLSTSGSAQGSDESTSNSDSSETFESSANIDVASDLFAETSITIDAVDNASPVDSGDIEAEPPYIEQQGYNLIEEEGSEAEDYSEDIEIEDQVPHLILIDEADSTAFPDNDLHEPFPEIVDSDLAEIAVSNSSEDAQFCSIDLNLNSASVELSASNNSDFNCAECEISSTNAERAATPSVADVNLAISYARLEVNAGHYLGAINTLEPLLRSFSTTEIFPPTGQTQSAAAFQVLGRAYDGFLRASPSLAEYERYIRRWEITNPGCPVDQRPLPPPVTTTTTTSTTSTTLTPCNGLNAVPSTNFCVRFPKLQDLPLAQRVSNDAENARLTSYRYLADNQSPAIWTRRCTIILCDGPCLVPGTNPPQMVNGYTSLVRGGRGVERYISSCEIGLNMKSRNFLSFELLHEVNHAVQGEIYRSIPAPRWADEGQAILAEAVDRTLPVEQRKGFNGQWHIFFNLTPTFTASNIMTMADYPIGNPLREFYALSAVTSSYLTWHKSNSVSKFVRFIKRSLNASFYRSPSGIKPITLADYEKGLWDEYSITSISSFESQFRVHLTNHRYNRYLGGQ